VRDARVVGDNIWRCVDRLCELSPTQIAAGIPNPFRRQATNQIVRYSSLRPRSNDYGREAMLTPNELDEFSVIARGPLPDALIRERRYDDRARFRASHQSNSVV